LFTPVARLWPNTVKSFYYAMKISPLSIVETKKPTIRVAASIPWAADPAQTFLGRGKEKVDNVHCGHNGPTDGEKR
jgi:hypothetical protein